MTLLVVTSRGFTLVMESDGPLLTLLSFAVFCPPPAVSCAEAVAASKSRKAKAVIEVLKTVFLVEFLITLLLIIRPELMRVPSLFSTLGWENGLPILLHVHYCPAASRRFVQSLVELRGKRVGARAVLAVKASAQNSVAAMRVRVRAVFIFVSSKLKVEPGSYPNRLLSPSSQFAPVQSPPKAGEAPTRHQRVKHNCRPQADSE